MTTRLENAVRALCNSEHTEPCDYPGCACGNGLKTEYLRTVKNVLRADAALPITDAEIEAAARVDYEHDSGRGTWSRTFPATKDNALRKMHAALEAFMKQRRKEIG